MCDTPEGRTHAIHSNSILIVLKFWGRGWVASGTLERPTPSGQDLAQKLKVSTRWYLKVRIAVLTMSTVNVGQ